MSSSILSPAVAKRIRKYHVEPDKMWWLTHNGVEDMQKGAANQGNQHKKQMAKTKKTVTTKNALGIILLIVGLISQAVVWNWVIKDTAPWGSGSFGVGNSIFVFVTAILFMFILLKRKARKKWYVLVAFLYAGIYYTAPTATAVIIFSQFIPEKLFMAISVPLIILGLKFIVISNKVANKTARLRTPKILKNNLWSEKEKKGQIVFGHAGGVGEAARIFGEGRAAAGAAGERQTAYLLDNMLSHIPGVNIYHGLRFPGSLDADIDHAVVIGDSVILVDTKMFRKGFYGLNSSFHHGRQQMTIFGGEKKHYDNHMDVAARSIRNMVKSISSIEVVILMHSQNGDAEVIPNYEQVVDSVMVRLEQAHTGMDRIGRKVSREAGKPVNEEIKQLMLSLLK